MPEQPEERLSVGHGRECGYDGLSLAEAFGVQLGIGSAEARADDHAELAGAAQAHDKLVAEGFGVGRHELYLQYALEVGSDGVLQRGPFQPPIALGSARRVAFDPFGVAFGHFGEHTAHGGTHLVRRFRHDAHAADFRFVDDGRRDDFKDGLVPGHGHDFFVREFGVAGNEGAFRGRFRSRQAQEVIHFVFVEELPPFGIGVAEQFRDRFVGDGKVHGCSLRDASGGKGGRRPP